MFESDDFDQILSHLDLPESSSTNSHPEENKNSRGNGEPEKAYNLPMVNIIKEYNKKPIKTSGCCTTSLCSEKYSKSMTTSNNSIHKSAHSTSPKNTKRKFINSLFDHKNKRKFPGPAGLLSREFNETKDSSICHMEILSQDVDFSQNNLQNEIFETPIWNRLLIDLEKYRSFEVDSIKSIKEQAQAGPLRRLKAQTITAFVETVDRSVIDPLILLRDQTGSIKGTLHRDAWSIFSTYIVSEYCAIILWKPTVLTTGSAFKKHYLNITLSNILAIYSSAVITNDEDKKVLPDGYVKECEKEMTIIKTDIPSNNDLVGSHNLLDGIDDSMFSDEILLM